MPVNWKAPDAFERLLAAMVAAQDMKLDYRKIATYYGNNATYDSIEGRFRIIKRQAAVLKAEIESGARPEAPARGTNNNGSGSAATTPKKPRSTNSGAGTPKSKGKGERTLGGRVGKSGISTPSKSGGNGNRGGGRMVKAEEEEEGEDVAEFAVNGGGAGGSFYSVESSEMEGGTNGAGEWDGLEMMMMMQGGMQMGRAGGMSDPFDGLNIGI